MNGQKNLMSVTFLILSCALNSTTHNIFNSKIFKEIKIVFVKPLNKNLRFVKPSILLGDKISQFNSLLLHDVKGKIRSKKNNFLTL